MTTLGDVIYWLKEVWNILQPIFEALMKLFKGGEDTPAEDEPVEEVL